MDSKIYAIQNSDNRGYHHQFLNKKENMRHETRTGWISRVTHKRWNLIDDCTKFILSVFLYLKFPVPVSFLSLRNS